MKHKHSFRLYMLSGLLLFFVIGCGNSNSKASTTTSKSSYKSAHVHTYSKEWTYDDNYHWHASTCAHKGLKQDYFPHDFSENWVIEQQSTEYVKGKRYRECNVCGYRQYEDIDILPHTHKKGTPSEENRVEPQCEIDGHYDLVYYCIECGEEISREQKTIPAKGHTLVHHDGKNPTCEEHGYKPYDTCMYCSYTTYEDLSPTGHEFGEPTYEWSSSYSYCTAKRVCKNDAQHVEYEMKFSSHETITEATYEHQGLERYTVHFDNSEFSSQVHDEIIPQKDMLKYYKYSDGYEVRADSQEIYGDIVIPEVYDDLPVTRVGSFFGCDNIESVVIPNSVTTINSNAFQSCSSLSSITVGNNVDYIGPYAFSETAISEIDIPDSTKTLGFCLFYGCENLTKVKIGKNAESLDSVLQGCNKIQELTIPYIGGSKTSDQYLCCLFGYADYLYNSAVPSTLKNLTILDSCTTFGNHALEYCNSIEKLTLPFIGESVSTNQFLGYIYGATSFEENETKVPSSLKRVELNANCGTIASNAFYMCASLEDITLYDGIETIEVYAFRGCSSIESFVVPSSVKTIQSSAFAYMTSLLSVNILSNNVQIGLSPFVGCPNLVLINVPDSNQNYSTINNVLYNKNHTALICCPNGLSGEITIPETVETINDYAFSGCNKITKVTLPSNITAIGKSTFHSCSSLQSVNIPYGTTTIGDYAFINCTSLQNMELPQTITALGNYSFFNCTSMETLSLPAGGNCTIGEYAFSNCTSLNSAILSNSVSSIGQFAFTQCTSLQNFNVPSSITSIEKSTFLYCTNMKQVSIPNNLQKIGHTAFGACEKLESISLPETVTEIGVGVFSNCSSIKAIRIPSLVTTISEEAFYKCTSLKEVWILNSYDPTIKKVLGPKVFAYCTALEALELPEVATIGDYAFYGCTSLWGIGFDTTLKNVGTAALYSCSNLTDIYYAGTTTQIKSITFGSSWRYNVPASVIHCDNGDVSIYTL